MSTQEAGATPGGFARERFSTRRRVWRRRFWWVFPVIAVVPIAIELPIVLLTHAPHRGFWLGVALGAGVTAACLLFDSPPAHIERWRIGAEGEKSTARSLRPLIRAGWELFNDIETGYGNIDHVLVGPAGVFLLESKRLAGRVKLEAGNLIVRWHEDPDDGYQNDSVGGRAKGAAAELQARIRRPGSSPWVQAVVVLWADFDQRSIEQHKVAWIRGNELAGVLADRPVKYTGKSLQDLISQTREAVLDLRAAS
jgi:hypothetical protein